MASVATVIRRHLSDGAWAYTTAGVILALGGLLGVMAQEALGAQQRAELLRVLGLFLTRVSAHHYALTGLAREGVGQSLRSLGLMLLVGLSIVGIPVLFLAVGFKGFAWGFAASFLVRELGARGLVLLCVGTLPGFLLTAPALMLVVAAALGFASAFWKSQFFRVRGRAAQALVRFAGLGCLAAGGVLLGALWNVYLTPLLLAWLVPYLK